MKRNVLLILLLVLTNFDSSFASTSSDINYELTRVDQTQYGRFLWSYLKSNCEKINIHSLPNFSTNWEKASSEKFDYYYYRKNEGLTETTVIFLPGGPGGLGSFVNTPNLSKIDHIKIDPRGLGCNYKRESNLQSSLITTKQTAQDIVNLIKRLKIKKYVIYGASYGTVLATHLAQQLESDTDTPNPIALVLEGTLGKTIGSHKNYTSAYHNIWNSLLIDYPFIENVLKNLGPYGLSAEQWGKLIVEALEKDSNELIHFFRLLKEIQDGIISDKRRQEFEKELQSRLYEIEDAPFSKEVLEYAGADRILRTIICNELSIDWNYHSFKMENLTLKVVSKKYWPSENLCKGLGPLVPYDSVNFQIETPIYYFQGSTDPQTPKQSARYHYENQVQTIQKVYQNIEGHGHRPLRKRLLPCADKIWAEVFKKSAKLNHVVSKKGHCL